MNWEIVYLLIFIVYTIVWVLLKFSYKIPIMIGIVLVLAGALSISLIKNETLASQIGIYAFYFLLSGATIALVGYLRAR